jgi:hypothetical protein
MFMHSIEYNYAPKAFANIWPKNNERNTGYALHNENYYVFLLPRINCFQKIPVYLYLLQGETQPTLNSSIIKQPVVCLKRLTVGGSRTCLVAYCLCLTQRSACGVKHHLTSSR